MTLLASAMFAVSSSSRSTSVKALSAGQRHTATSRQLRALTVAATRIATESRLDERGIDEGLNIDRTDEECLDDACGAIEGGAPLTALTSGCTAPWTKLRSARVNAAENMAAAWRWPAALVDCRSHYDAVYDRLIYGSADDDFAGRRLAERPIEEPVVADSDWLTTFQTLVEPRHVRPQPEQAGATTPINFPRLSWTSWSSVAGALALGRGTLDVRNDMAQVRTIAIGFRTWVEVRAGQWIGQWGDMAAQFAGCPTEAVSWIEYAELIDRASTQADATSLSVRTSDSPANVRSGDWLRHSAASSLYQLGLLLELAGRELDHGNLPMIAGPQK